MRARQTLAASLCIVLSSAVAHAQDTPPSAPLSRPRVTWSADFTFAAVRDESLRGALGREQQIKPVAAIVAMHIEVTPRLSIHVASNPVRDDRAPRPFVPGDDDRRTYFFPNQPDVIGGRGVASDPEGLYKVDAYKHSGLDPLLQMYLLRSGYAEIHNAARTVGLRAGRFVVRQGLALDELTWFTAKDLTTIQLVNAQADNGLAVFWQRPSFEVTTQVITGNGSPYHDYGYFDFTDAVEDKNSSVGVVVDGRVRTWKDRVMVGGSYRSNFVNSRVEDALTMQLSKRNDDAQLVYARLTLPHVKLYGEWASYTVGLAPSSAALLSGPPVQSPVRRDGRYAGAAFEAPVVFGTRLSGVVEVESTSRNDALVAWATANELFGVRLGANIKATNLKLVSQWGNHLSAFWFGRLMTNPFPQLSAITPISGPNSDRGAHHAKFGLGLRLRF